MLHFKVLVGFVSGLFLNFIFLVSVKKRHKWSIVQKIQSIHEKKHFSGSKKYAIMALL
jgi:hypothetical protein